MFDRGILFVGAKGLGLSVLAEALALDILRELEANTSTMHPLRVYSATLSENAQTDPVLLRAMKRLQIEVSGLSIKPLALYAFAGAPRIDHVVMLDAELPPATKLAIGETVDVWRWDIDPACYIDKKQPGPRYLDYLKTAENLRPKVAALLTDLTNLSDVAGRTFIDDIMAKTA
ncbi:MAG: hypothetical protein AAF590_12725 [Pseudomonadota bacterium]